MAVRAPSMTMIQTAYHEAGHAVLSAAINDAPRHVSIRPNAGTLGRSRARVIAGPASIAQIYLAGFAAEHLLVGRRSRQLDAEIGFAIASRRSPALRKAFIGSEGQDGCRAVREVLRMGLGPSGVEIRTEIERFYGIARCSLSAVWPSVERVAGALLAEGELDGSGVNDALGDVAALRKAVLRVQRVHGLGSAPRLPPLLRLPRRASAEPAS